MHGFIVGSAGIVISTTDGGSTWIQQSSGASMPLFCVSFVNENFGTAVGFFGKIINTTDRGETGRVKEAEPLVHFMAYLLQIFIMEQLLVTVE